MIFKLEFALKQRDKSKKFYYYYDILIRKKDETIRLYIKKKKKEHVFSIISISLEIRKLEIIRRIRGN